MNAPLLLPCPFCGCTKIGTHSERDFDEFGTYHAIQCHDCGARSRQHYVSDGNDCPQHRQEVRDDWNKRAAFPVETSGEPHPLKQQVDGIVSAMRSVLGRQPPYYCNEIRLPAEGAEALLSYIADLQQFHDWALPQITNPPSPAETPAPQRPTSFSDCDECIGGCDKCMPSVKSTAPLLPCGHSNRTLCDEECSS